MKKDENDKGWRPRCATSQVTHFPIPRQATSLQKAELTKRNIRANRLSPDLSVVPIVVCRVDSVGRKSIIRDGMPLSRFENHE